MNLPNFLFTISKNFPYQAGLGSSSSNVATVIRILENLELIKKKNIYHYVNLGSDVPIFLYQHDALVRGKGDLLSKVQFPKYYFLIVQPSFRCSTKTMYQSFKPSDFDYNQDYDLEEINDQDNGNDFEKIIQQKNNEFSTLSNFLQNLEGMIFTRLTGSGSCIFSTFDNKVKLQEAYDKTSMKYPNLWVTKAENNLINIF